MKDKATNRLTPDERSKNLFDHCVARGGGPCPACVTNFIAEAQADAFDEAADKVAMRIGRNNNDDAAMAVLAKVLGSRAAGLRVGRVK